jgi:hypothetical protein
MTWCLVKNRDFTLTGMDETKTYLTFSVDLKGNWFLFNGSTEIWAKETNAVIQYNFVRNRFQEVTKKETKQKKEGT